MLYIITNEKGGVGKSLTSTVVASLLAEQGRKFQLVEIDDHNESLIFQNSEILTKNNTHTIKLNKKDQEIEKIFFQIMSDPGLDYIVDIGGSHNTTEIIPILKEVDFDKTWIIPVNRVKKYITNADKTADLIGDPDNTIFLLNQYSILESIKDDFLYFFGSKELGIEKESRYFDSDNYLAIPFSNSFQFSEDGDQTIYDLAQIAYQLNPNEARKYFFNESNGDEQEYINSMNVYKQSQKAKVAFEKIKENFSKLLG